MNDWIDPHVTALPEDGLRHCASVFLLSPVLCALVLVTVLYLIQRGRRPLAVIAHACVGFALLAAACEPCVEILRRASVAQATASLSASMPVSWSPVAIASHLTVYTGLATLLVVALRTRGRARGPE